MWRIPDYAHNVSLRMSQVMDEIGVNETIVMKRRKSGLLRESIETLTDQLVGKDMYTYFFGSRTEGTTTQGLHSDTDGLFSINRFNVIQELSEWKRGKYNLLMIQDETVLPGYCLLQELRDDAPLPQVVETRASSYRDKKGRIFLSNTIFNVNSAFLMRLGPALYQQGSLGIRDADIVPAFPCISFPAQVRQWLDEHRDGLWPSHDMRQCCCNSKCFVVGVGNKDNVNEKFEWRISTSLAERCLMFNLNITQIRCYVLMKIILKSFFIQRCPQKISSFMCKNVLLHCISNSNADEWKENTLVKCLLFCLSTLYNCVLNLNEYCPHVIIQENNLMLRRFIPETKPYILETLLYVIESNGRALLEIKCDSIGASLLACFSGIAVSPANSSLTLIAGEIVMNSASSVSYNYKELLCTMNDLPFRKTTPMFSMIMSYLNDAHHQHMDNIAISLIAQLLCQTIGSVLTCLSIYQGNLTHETLNLMSLGLNSDVTSGKLKLASIFFCIGYTNITELILTNIEDFCDLSVPETICNCYSFAHVSGREEFNNLCYESNEEYILLKNKTSLCVRFLKCEALCCPFELQYEMYRSTQEDLSYRDDRDNWMSLAVIDSLPFLYFLQFRTYASQGKQDEKQKALFNLVRTIETEPNLGHRETALNLLGQCMEKENQIENAFKCYALSLNLRGRNNASKIHICILLNKVINQSKH